MKNIFRKITALFLVAILMLSITSFSIYKHFCNDNLVEISNYSKIDSCCKSKLISNNYNNLKFSKKDCCKNEIEIKNNTFFQNTDSFKILKPQYILAFSFKPLFVKKLDWLKATNLFYQDFSPPNFSQNKQVLFQTFLI